MKRLVVLGSILATVCAASAATTYYYWTGLGSDMSVRTAANWAMESGEPATVPPDSDSILVFTNAVSGLVMNSNFRFTGFWAKEGGSFATASGVTVNIGSFGFRVDGSGVCKAGYTTSLYNGTNYVRVARADGEFQVENSLNAQANTLIVKEGAGTFKTVNSYGSTVNDFHEMVMRDGKWIVNPTDSRLKTSGTTLTFDGDCANARVVRNKSNDPNNPTTALPFACIRETESVVDTTHGITDDGHAFTLVLEGASVTRDSYFSGRIYSKFSFKWNPSDASRIFTFAKAQHPMTGNFSVLNGTVRLVDRAGFGAINTLTVADGATLEIGEGSKIFAVSAVVGGTTLSPGAYSAEEAGLSGEGALVVTGAVPAESEATWTGNGTDTLVTNPENWGEVGSTDLPDLYRGTTLVKINGAATLTLPANAACVFRGIASSSSTDVTVTGETGAFLYLDSCAVTNAGAGKLTFDLPLVLRGSHSWYMAGDVELSAKATVESLGIPFGKWGTGKFIIRSSNPYFGSMTQRQGDIEVYADNALGGAGVLCTRDANIAKDTNVILHDCSLANDFYIQGGTGGFYAWEGTCAIGGLVTCKQPNIEYFGTRSVARLYFRGGVVFDSNNNGASYSPSGVTHIWVENRPLNITKMMLGTSDKNATGMDAEFHLDVAANKFPRGLILRYDKTASNVLYTGVPNALALDGGGVSFADDATKSSWNLCGCDQQANIFFSRCLGAKVTSEQPATLHLVDEELNYRKPTERDNGNMVWSIQGAASQVDRSTFAGAASFSKEGALTHYMLGESTSTGGVYVAKGELVFTKAATEKVTLPQTSTLNGPEKDGYAFTPYNGSWKNASEAVVTGGTLTLEHGQVFGKATDVKVSGDGVINLAAGVVQKCHTLTIGETVYDSGTWGGPDSDAEHKDAHFAGTGKFRVVGEGLGLMLFIR